MPAILTLVASFGTWFFADSTPEGDHHKSREELTKEKEMEEAKAKEAAAANKVCVYVFLCMCDVCVYVLFHAGRRSS